MKPLFNSTVLALVLTLGSAFALAQNSPKAFATYQGTWTLTERVCSDGKPANDRYDLTRDSMTLTLTANRGRFDLRVNGEAQALPVGIDLRTEQIYLKDSDGKWQWTHFALFDAETLILITDGFGERGSCAIEKKLYSTFKKTI